MPHPEIPSARPSPGTAVWLHGLSTTNLNGQRAIVLASVADGRAACPLAGGRCPVQLETSGSATISVKLSNLSLTPSEALQNADANLWGPPEGTNAPSVLGSSLPSRHGAHPGGLDPPFCIKLAGQAGLGVFATRFIPAGTRIIAEAPLFSFKNPSASLSNEDYDRAWMTALHTAIASLSNVQRDEFYQLANSYPPDAVHKMGLDSCTFQSNSFGTGAGSESSSIFLTCSRFNHSCTPNMHQCWNTALKECTVHAMVDISIGDELFISYIVDLQEHSVRQEGLKTSYHFVCCCKVCSLTGQALEASDLRRRQILLGQNTTKQSLSLGKHMHVLVAAKERIQLLKEEGIVNILAFMEAFEAAFQACKHASQHQAARAWLHLLHEQCILARGYDSPSLSRYKQLLACSVELGHVGTNRAGDS